jgi:hypothetical protein
MYRGVVNAHGVLPRQAQQGVVPFESEFPSSSTGTPRNVYLSSLISNVPADPVGKLLLLLQLLLLPQLILLRRR